MVGNVFHFLQMGRQPWNKQFNLIRIRIFTCNSYPGISAKLVFMCRPDFELIILMIIRIEKFIDTRYNFPYHFILSIVALNQYIVICFIPEFRKRIRMRWRSSRSGSTTVNKWEWDQRNFETNIHMGITPP
ncbi:hypothetical protein DLM86_23895, partial [Paenibacillus flagellatus]